MQPILDQGPPVSGARHLDIEAWKNEKVLKDHDGNQFTRWGIVLAVANQDGGAHVDPGLDEAYYRLAKLHSIGWIASGPEGEQPLQHIEKVYVRHIAWEAFNSICAHWNKIKGNRWCECGSGRKKRYCCGKAA